MFNPAYRNLVKEKITSVCIVNLQDLYGLLKLNISENEEKQTSDDVIGSLRSPEGTRLWRKRLRSVVGLFLGGLFLYLTLRNVDLAEVGDILIKIHLVWLIPLLLISLTTLWLRSLRWSWMFPNEARPSLREAFDAFMIGTVTNNLVPGRVGDLLRAGVIGKHLPSIGIGGAIATVVLEKVLDVAVVLLLLGLTFALAPLPDWLARAGLLGTLILLFSLVGLGFLSKLNKRNQASHLPDTGASRVRRLSAKVSHLIQRFSGGLHGLSNSKSFFLLMGAGIVIWLLECMIIFICFQAFEINLPFVAAMVTMVFLCVGTMLPAAPGFIGTYQFFIISALHLYLVPESQALALALFLNIFVIVVTTVVGLIAISLEGGLISVRRMMSNG